MFKRACHCKISSITCQSLILVCVAFNLKLNIFGLQYLRDLKERGARVIIADFYEPAARHIMCQAYRLGMTQAQGYVWFIPGWYREGWYDLDLMKRKKHLNEVGGLSSI